jgi:hypothetical protein
MTIPIISAGVKQADQLSRFRIDPGDVGPLVPITVNARQCQITGAARATMLLCYDVVDLERRGM